MKTLNKYKVSICALFSCLFSLSVLLDTKLVSKDANIGVFSLVHIAKFEIQDLFRFLLFFLINLAFCFLFLKIYDWLEAKIKWKHKKIPRFFFLSFCLLILCWLPYILSYFPGGVYSDTFNSVFQTVNLKANGLANLNNHHPILYTFFIKFCIFITRDNPFVNLTHSFIVVQIFQVLGCAFSLAYCLSILNKKKIPNVILYLFLAFFCLYPLVPLYVISIWKDTPYNFVLILFIVKIFDILTSPSSFLEEKKQILSYSILALLVCFLRNNGIYIVAGTTVVLWIFNNKELLKQKRPFFLASLLVLCLTVLIQGPIYNTLHLNKDTAIESVAIPFQQIANAIQKDESIQKEDVKWLDEVIPLSSLRESYHPLYFDFIKWHENFDNEAFNRNKSNFIRLWLHLLPTHLGDYVEAYLLETIGFWDIFRNANTAYYQLVEWPFEGENMKINQKDLFFDITHISFRKIISSMPLINTAIFVWIMLGSLLMTLLKKKWKYLILYVPSFLSWLTIMIATPAGFSLRYIYILVLMIPFHLLIPLLPYKGKDENLL